MNKLSLTGIAPEIQIEADATGVGQFLTATAKTPAPWHQFRLGMIDGLARFTACYRYDPFWMRPVAGTTHAAVPAETQYLLAERADGRCLLIVPLFGEQFRFALAGDATGLLLVGETNDPFAAGTGGLAAFVAEGDDPFALMEAAARAVVHRLGVGRRRVDKPLPAFVNDFGWCTWDAFYGEVSPEKVRSGLESFRAGGVEPRLLILDDGWLQLSAENRLQSLTPNEKFAGTLAPTVAMAKQEFGVRTLLVWHAALGHWGGFDVERLTGYGARNIPRWHGPGLLTNQPVGNVAFGTYGGMLPAEQFAKFYDDLHRQLAAWGVDGVKVDGQAMLEGLATGSGGRVAVYRAFRQALEASVQKHFGGTLINCMSNANEIHLMCRDSTLLRTSTDFWPNSPDTHGAHLYCNAQVGMWFGQLIHPDWDMFQSNHERGAFHAAGRAISGGPVYVSDKPDGHNFDVLRKLVLSDGSVLRAERPGLPTRDCLFHDPTREDVLLKIWNTNPGGTAVLGVFHCQYHADPAERHEIAGHVTAPVAGEEFAVFAHNARTVRRVTWNEKLPVRLPEGGWEVFTFARIENGFAALGLADKYNGGAAVVGNRLRDGGEFVAWCDRPPRGVTVNGTAVEFTFAAGALWMRVPVGGGTLRVDFTG